jgi:hypothetical protein
VRRLLAILAVATGLGAPAAADAVVSGRSAQALRCAAYIGMTASLGYDEGVLTAAETGDLNRWSAEVLRRWVPLAPEGQLAAYRAILGELGSRDRAYALFVRHADWCLREFTPHL